MKSFRDMNKETLDLAYDCTKTVSDFPALYEEMQKRSIKTYRQFPYANIAYGPGSRNTFDLFTANIPDAPTYIFIHGGYWQACQKEDFAYIAEGPLKKGFNVVLIEYTIAPEASMTQIMQEINQSLDYIQKNMDALGLTKGKICLSGHSAGGHLTAANKDHPVVSHAFPLSPLVELEPISLSFLNDALSLTPQEIEKYSPIRHVKKGVPQVISVGGDELPELIRHAREYYEAMKACGNDVRYIPSKSHNHFSLLDELSEHGEITTALIELMKK